MRNLLLIIITGILTVGIMGCDLNHQVEQAEERTIIRIPDISKIDPVVLLDIRKANPDLAVYIDMKPPRDWMKEEHVAKLMELIDSQEPCACIISSVYLVYSTDIIEECSTVGDEAMGLIARFRRDKSPEYRFNPDPDEYRKWWSERKKSNIRK